MRIPRFRTIIGRCGPAISASGLARRPRSGGGMKRAVRWALLSVGLAGVVMAVTVGPAPSRATPPSGLTNTPLARGTNTSHGTIPLQFGTDVAMVQITVDPGGSAGWHSHPGGAIVVVEQGRSPFTHRSAPSARPPRTARGRRSSSDLAKWITSSTPVRSHTSFSSPSRVCLRATPRELTSRTRARARVSDDLTKRDLPRGKGVALCRICGLLTKRNSPGSPQIRGWPAECACPPLQPQA